VVATDTEIVVSDGPLGETEEGETKHVDPEGAPVQLRPTDCLKPALALSVRGYEAVWPGLTVCPACEKGAREKLTDPFT
jgi:hypothetical protein